MTRARLTAIARRLAPPLTALTALGVIAAHAPPTLINESASLPRGVYVRAEPAPLRRGMIVALAQPVGARPYLATLGAPPDMRLLKRVAALPGETACRVGGHVVLPGRRVAVRDRDSRGVALPSWRACRRLRAGEVFLLGDTLASFDSRYFGPVAIADLDGPYQEMLTW